MRKAIWMICILLCGCAAPAGTAEGGTAIFGFNGESKEGIYHLVSGQQGNQVYYYDGGSDMDVPLCNLPNCEHTDPTCPSLALTAYEDKRMSIPPLYAGDQLYLFYENTSTLENVLCTAKVDGSDRKELMQLPQDIIVSAVIEGDKLYMTCNGMAVDEDGALTGTSNTYKNYVISLGDKQVKQLETEESTALYYLGSYEGTVYAQAVSDTGGIYQTDLVTISENKIEVKKENVQTLSHLIGKYAYWNRNGLIMQCDVTTGEDKQYWTPVNGDYKIQSIRPDGLMVLLQENSTGDTWDMYYADLCHKKIIQSEDTPAGFFHDNLLVKTGEQGLLKKG